MRNSRFLEVSTVNFHGASDGAADFDVDVGGCFESRDESAPMIDDLC